MNEKPIHPYNDPDQIEKTLLDFKTLDLSLETFESVSHKLNKDLGFIPSKGICIKKGTELFRARKNPVFGNKMFGDLSQLSIREASHIKSFGRANIPGQAVFYCSLDPLTAAREVTQWHLDDMGALIKKGVTFGNYNPFTQFMTISKWVTKKDLYFITTFDDEEVFGEDMSADPIYLHLLNRYQLDKDKFKMSQKMVINFFGSEFSKNNINGQFDYYISSYYSDIIYTKSPPEVVNGVIYLSIAYDLEGYNLAIPNQCLTNLEFQSAEFCYTYNSKGKDGFEDQKIVVAPTSKAILKVNSDNELEWVDVVGL